MRMKQPPEDPKNRRQFLKRAAIVSGSLPFTPGFVGGAAVAGFSSEAQALAAHPAAVSAAAADPVRGYTCFSQDESAFVETMVDVMCPADQYTPSGVDCGLSIFMDRQLSGPYGKAVKWYMDGPWMPGKPQQGYQLPLTPEQYFRAGVAAANKACKARFQKTFDQLSPSQADAFLKDLADGKLDSGDMPLGNWFHSLVYPLFNQACFADPIYGGNYDKVFWKLIGFPGLPAYNSVNIVQYRGKPFPPAKDPKSIADFS